MKSDYPYEVGYNSWVEKHLNGVDKPCNHPSHNPPTMLYIPPGQSRTHTCPRCGQKTTTSGSSYSL